MHYPRKFAEDSFTVGIEVEDAVNDGNIDLAVLEGKMLSRGLAEFNIFQTRFLRSSSCAIKHRAAEVNADDPSGRASSTGCY